MKPTMYILKKINKITLSFNHDKKLRSFNNVKSYPYGTSDGKVRKKELLPYVKAKKLNIKDH